MTALLCPRCGSTLPGAATPGTLIVCPGCAKAVRPTSLGPVAEPPPVCSALPQPPDPGWIERVEIDRVGAAGPPCPAPAGAAETPWSGDSLQGAIPLPFNPQTELAAEEPKPAQKIPPIWILGGLVAFLVVLIGAVELARVLRPRLTGHPRVDRQALQRVVERLQNGTEASRREAAVEIVAMGPAAVVAALDRITIEDRVGDKFFMVPGAVRALAGVGEDGVEGLRRALASPELNIRFAAASVLREMGAPGRAALPDLVAALKDPNRHVRGFAIDSLGNLGSDAGPAVETLAGLVENADVFVRRRAIDALARIGPAALPALPVLTKAQEQDADAAVRRAAAGAIRQINVAQVAEESLARATDELRQTVKAFLGDDKPSALAAAKTLGSMGGPGQEAIPSLALATRDKDPWRRVAAVRALGDLGLLVREFIPTLQAAAKEADPDVRAAAEAALVLIQGK